MTDIELYREIGVWLNRYHRRDWPQRQGLIKDFQHDIWILLRGKVVNTAYIKRRAYNYPVCTGLSKYFNYSRISGKREVVMLTQEGGYVDYSGDRSVWFEFPPVKKIRTDRYKRPKPVKVTYITGVVESFTGIPELAESLNIHKDSLYRLIGKPLQGKYPNRKISHVKLIEYENL